MKRFAFASLVLLAACPPPKGGGLGGDAFRVIYPDADTPRGLVVKVGEHMQAKPPPPKGGGLGGDAFRVIYPDADTPRGLVVKVGEHMQAKPAAQDCTGPDGAEGRWTNTGTKVTTGELPPGLVIEDGAIAGVPSKEGTYQVTIRFTGVTCASAPTDDKLVHVTIVVEPA